MLLTRALTGLGLALNHDTPNSILHRKSLWQGCNELQVRGLGDGSTASLHSRGSWGSRRGPKRGRPQTATDWCVPALQSTFVRNDEARLTLLNAATCRSSQMYEGTRTRERWRCQAGCSLTHHSPRLLGRSALVLALVTDVDLEEAGSRLPFQSLPLSVSVHSDQVYGVSRP